MTQHYIFTREKIIDEEKRVRCLEIFTKPNGLLVQLSFSAIIYSEKLNKEIAVAKQINRYAISNKNIKTYFFCDNPSVAIDILQNDFNANKLNIKLLKECSNSYNEIWIDNQDVLAKDNCPCLDVEINGEDLASYFGSIKSDNLVELVEQTLLGKLPIYEALNKKIPAEAVGVYSRLSKGEEILDCKGKGL